MWPPTSWAHSCEDHRRRDRQKSRRTARSPPQSCHRPDTDGSPANPRRRAPRHLGRARAMGTPVYNNQPPENGSLPWPATLRPRSEPTLARADEKCDGGVAGGDGRGPFRSANRPPDARPRLNLAQRIANPIRFPFNNFTYSLTLFSKFFSSFPHGTCSLSVSCQYLALDGVYHPLWAAFPNNPTRRKQLVSGQRSATDGVLTLYDVLFQATWTAPGSA